MSNSDAFTRRAQHGGKMSVGLGRRSPFSGVTEERHCTFPTPGVHRISPSGALVYGWIVALVEHRFRPWAELCCAGNVARVEPDCLVNRLDVDPVLLYYCIEGTLRGRSVRIGNRLIQGNRRNIPGNFPFVLTPTARTLLTAVTNNRIPITIRIGLTDAATWNENASSYSNAEPPLRPGHGTLMTVNSAVNTSPPLPDV